MKKFSLYIFAFGVGLLVLANEASAGKMKDLQLAHLEAVAFHLFGNYDTDILDYRNSKFVKAEAHFDLAISSEFSVYDPQDDDWHWIQCTTQFLEVKEKEYEVKSTDCTN